MDLDSEVSSTFTPVDPVKRYTFNAKSADMVRISLACDRTCAMSVSPLSSGRILLDGFEKSFDDGSVQRGESLLSVSGTSLNRMFLVLVDGTFQVAVDSAAGEVRYTLRIEKVIPIRN